MSLIWQKIKCWFSAVLAETAKGSVATSMWSDGYTDWEIEEVLRSQETKDTAEPKN